MLLQCLFHSSADSDRFGTKMLEKMGWSKGKGLGANLDGEQNFIRVAHKADTRGMGFSDRDDQWTQHEDEFNSLLKSLDNSRGGSMAASENEAEEDDDGGFACVGFGFKSNEKKKEKSVASVTSTLSGKSLEEQSKSSKARVHYKKFTRNKDLSRYSEKDLANIFGKKAFGGDDTPPEPDTKEENANEDFDFGITTVETGTSIADYFKNKKAEKISDDTVDGEIVPQAVVLSEKEPKKKKKKKDRETFDEEVVGESIDSTEVVPEHAADVCDEQKKKKKKKDKEPVECEIVTETIEESEPVGTDEAIAGDEGKKKKKKKSKAIIEDEVEPSEVADASDEPKKKKKKKSSKNEDEITNNVDEDSTEPIVTVQTENSMPKKTKKRKRTDEANVEASKTADPSDEPVVPSKEKKQKSSEVTSAQPVNIVSNLLSAMIKNKQNLMGNYSTEADGLSGEKATLTAMSPYISFGENIYEINRYQAEVFRFLDLDGFGTANLSDLAGYGYTKNLELKVTAKSRDNDKISDLWDHALVTKYGNDAVKAKKKQKYSIKTLKKKNLFKGI